MVSFVNEQMGKRAWGWGALPPEGSLNGNRMNNGNGGVKERGRQPAGEGGRVRKAAGDSQMINAQGSVGGHKQSPAAAARQ